MRSADFTSSHAVTFSANTSLSGILDFYDISYRPQMVYIDAGIETIAWYVRIDRGSYSETKVVIFKIGIVGIYKEREL